MTNDGIAHQLAAVRHHAEQLIAQRDDDSRRAASLLQAITELEQQLAINAAALHQAETQNGQFRQALLEMPLGLCLLDGADYRYTFTNPAYDQLAGRTDMLGKTVHDVFPELEGQGIYELLDAVYTTGEPYNIAEMMVKLDRDGDGVAEDVYFDLAYRPLRDAAGTITGVISQALDIGDRRVVEQQRASVLQLTLQAQHVAEAERQRLLYILHQAPAAICTLKGPQHVFTFANPSYERLVGRNDLVGQTVRVIFPEVEGQGFFELLDDVYTTGVTFVGDEMALELDRGGDGTLERSYLNFIYAPMRDGNDTIIGLFVEAVDVTELVRARQAAEAGVVVRDQFLSIAAHELKTPLTSILGYIQVLQRRMRRSGDVDERTDRTLTMIGAQGQRLTRLIDTLMDVSRINQGHLTLERAPLDLGMLTSRVVDELSVTLDRRVFQISIPPQPCVVWGDSSRLEQALVNLVQNAVKYSPAGGAVAVSVGCDTTQAWVIIRDSGIGIPAAALPHLFDRFYRVADEAAQFIGGMGIGLSVVKEVVMLHGGTVAVESTEGAGSTFTVWLPLM